MFGTFSKNFQNIFKKSFFRKTFRNFENIFFVQDFFVTRYGYVVCKNRNFRTLLASQQRTRRHTLKISRILIDKLTLVVLSRTGMFSYYLHPETIGRLPKIATEQNVRASFSKMKKYFYFGSKIP